METLSFPFLMPWLELVAMLPCHDTLIQNNLISINSMEFCQGNRKVNNMGISPLMFSCLFYSQSDMFLHDVGTTPLMCICQGKSHPLLSSWENTGLMQVHSLLQDEFNHGCEQSQARVLLLLCPTSNSNY